MAKETPKNGLHTEYYDKGQMKLEENYKDGKFDGKSRRVVQRAWLSAGMLKGSLTEGRKKK
ncbi:hypothetical protein OAR79_03175 [Candidatus Thioglobus sp.]|nr:hypothetical protein [Candidatus Thioglobus sp.]